MVDGTIMLWGRGRNMAAINGANCILEVWPEAIIIDDFGVCADS